MGEQTNIEFLPTRTDMTPEEALQLVLTEVRAEGMKQILVVGMSDDDQLIIRSSDMTTAQANWLLDLAKMHALSIARDDRHEE